MKMWTSSWRRRLPRAVVTLMLLCIYSGAEPRLKQGQLIPGVSLAGDVVTFSILNSSAGPQRFFNCLDREFPGRAWIRARDRNKQILTRTDFSPDGYWSPASREGLGVLLPAKLDVLESGHKISKRVSVKAMLLECHLDEAQAERIRNFTVEVQLLFKVYVDKDLSRCVKKETEWIPFHVI